MNKPPPKTRANSPLRGLPEDRQAAIFELIQSKTLAEVKRSLAADGLIISLNALSKFRTWYMVQQNWRDTEETTDAIIEQIKAGMPGLSESQILEYGQKVFTTLAIRNQDADTWQAAQRIRQKDEELHLDRQKFQRETCELFLKWFADQQAKSIASAPSSNAEKIDQLGELMFGEDWK